MNFPARLYLAVAVVLWGTSFASTKAALDYFPPVTLIWLRMVVASVVVLLCWRTVPRTPYLRGDWKQLGLLVLLEPCLYFLFEAYALRYTTSGQAGVISSLVPLLVVAAAWIVLRERVTTRMVTGLLVSLAGVVVLSLTGESDGQASAPLLGNFLELAAMVCAAGYIITLKRLTERYHPWFLTALQSFAGALFFLPGLFQMPAAAWSGVDPAGWLHVAYLGTLVSLAAFGCYSMGVQRVAASTAAIYINLIPVIAVLTGWWLLGERLGLVQWCAAAAILCGVAYGQSRRVAGSVASEVA